MMEISIMWVLVLLQDPIIFPVTWLSFAVAIAGPGQEATAP